MGSKESPIEATLEYDNKKINGFIMKLTTLGVMFELDLIEFSVGAFLNLSFVLNGKTQITERVRTIKHYDKFYRTPPTKVQSKVAPVEPKKLVELHFKGLTESSRVAITKHLILSKTR